MTDHELLSQYVAGSQAAFAAVVSRHIDAVYTAARRQVRDPHLAEDVVQAVFIILSTKARSIAPGATVAGWLINTTYFAARDALKKQLRRQRHEQKAAAMAPTSHTNQSQEIWDRVSPELDAALRRLGESDRGIVALRFLERKSIS